MITFPMQLPPVQYGNTYARPTVESASSISCLARAHYSPKDIRYETVVRLDDGKWIVDTKTSKGYNTSDEHYPQARGHQIALAVINWWLDAFYVSSSAVVDDAVANTRATWISRTTHKLLTEVGEYCDQVAALQILATSYNVRMSSKGTLPSLKGANWATASNRFLEISVPEPQRRAAVALLVEIITGLKEPRPSSPAQVVAGQPRIEAAGGQP